MSQARGTTSSNHSETFGICTTALLALRCCQKNKDVVITINDSSYSPWHDLVVRDQDQTICVLLTHEAVVNKKKFKESLEARPKIMQKNKSVIFARLAIASDNSIKQYSKQSSIPEVLRLIVDTNDVYYDEKGSTYFCVEQNDVTVLETDIAKVLQELLGTCTKPQLRKIQTLFLEFIQNRFYRLSGSGPMTLNEIRKNLGYIVLGLFKVPFGKLSGKKETIGDFGKILRGDVVVLNHRVKSVVKDNIWGFLQSVYPGLEQGALDSAWFNNELYMPLLSVDGKADRVICRALQITGFGSAKVVVLRPRVFAFKKFGKVLTILQGLPSSVDDVVELRVGAEQETFKFAEVRPDRLNSESVHADLFSGLAREFGCQNTVREGHDEVSYINDEGVLGQEPLTALISAIKTPGIDVSVVDDLIKLGADVDKVVIGGHGPMYFAVEANRYDLVELLLRNGAQPDLADKYGSVPLFYACAAGRTKIVELLLQYNSNRNAADFYGVTPMFMAYMAKNYELLRVILNGNKDPIAADVDGNHLLHRAAIDGDLSCLKCVIDTVPDIDAFIVGDVLGKTPLELAQEHNHHDFADLLKKSLKIQD